MILSECHEFPAIQTHWLLKEKKNNVELRREELAVGLVTDELVEFEK